MVQFLQIFPSFVFLVLYVFPNTGKFSFFHRIIKINLKDCSWPQRDKSLGLFLRYYFVHGYLLFAYSRPHISHQTFCLFKNPSFIFIAWFYPTQIQFLSFCFKNLLRFRFTMTTSLNHSEFYIFKMN